ncbi:MAG: LysR family transcriptional regulator [Acetobacteraceae bacterium]|nr:LysR family transcriptional regulator [Acetobacteraceae bacterium]
MTDRTRSSAPERGQLDVSIKRRALQLAVQVGRHGSIRLAARAAKLTAAVASRRISGPGDELGVSRFERGPSGVRTTGAGARFPKAARRMCFQAARCRGRHRAAGPGLVRQFFVGTRPEALRGRCAAGIDDAGGMRGAAPVGTGDESGPAKNGMGRPPRFGVGLPGLGGRADRSPVGALAGRSWRTALWSVAISRRLACGWSRPGRPAARGAGRHARGSGGRTPRRSAAQRPTARRCTSERNPRDPAAPAPAGCDGLLRPGRPDRGCLEYRGAGLAGSSAGLAVRPHRALGRAEIGQDPPAGLGRRPARLRGPARRRAHAARPARAARGGRGGAGRRRPRDR